MNNDQFNQTEVLIGGSRKTTSFKVSDDPMLMSMLSTGFYAYPHRAMVQEVMFNAWDAHRMGNCQDRPIDIYISIESGFVVRDYGPGIHDDKMEEVYCTYAASTKRDDSDMTGGFGLGSKSPWSYTESFTVTSHHKGTRTMYLMSRVSDEADGKPGMTPLMTLPTEETGLSVAVPLVEKDVYETKKHVLDVLYLSGIKANIHYMNDPVMLRESESISPGHYILSREHTGASLNAVYGGVRYIIPPRDEYAEEFEFIKLLSTNSPLFIGFAPHTLSPLPNREGLNMSTKTKESIRAGLELCMERFQEVFGPLVQSYYRQRFDAMRADGIKAEFALYYVVKKLKETEEFVSKFQKVMVNLPPLGADKSVWRIAVDLIGRQPYAMVNVMGDKKWMAIILSQFVRVYPDDKHLAYKLMKEDPKPILNSHDTGILSDVCFTDLCTKQVSELFEFEQAQLKDFPEKDGFAYPKIRLYDDSSWQPMERNRNAPKGIAYRYMGRSTRKVGTKAIAPVVKYLDPNNLWSGNSAELVVQPFVSKVVILAKTVACLKEVSYDLSHYFDRNKNNGYQYKNCTPHTKYHPIPAYVIHSRKGGYDNALRILNFMGFTVIEAPDPEKGTYKKKGSAPKIVKQYARINLRASNWQNHLIDPSQEGYDKTRHGVPLENPTHFLYIKESVLTGHSYYSDKPNIELMIEILKIYPDIAMVCNITQAEKLEEDGVKSFKDLMTDWYDTMERKVYRFRNVVRVIKVEECTKIPMRLLKHQHIQSAFGIAKIKEDDSAFWEEVLLIKEILRSKFTQVSDVSNRVKDLVIETWKNDDQRPKIKKAIDSSNFLSLTKINNHWSSLDKTERDDLALKVARFIRTL